VTVKIHKYWLNLVILFFQNEGVYCNARLTHVATALIVSACSFWRNVLILKSWFETVSYSFENFMKIIHFFFKQGAKVLIQVKNGGQYEGIFKTFSPKVRAVCWYLDWNLTSFNRFDLINTFASWINCNSYFFSSILLSN